MVEKIQYQHRLYLFLLALSIFLLDQVSKWMVCENLSFYHDSQILPFFSLYLAHNTGAAFSFLSSAAGWQRWLFVGIAVFIGGVIITCMWRLPKKQGITGIALALILGGALGNVWDRLTLGYVIDFLLLHWHQFQWPVFNLADSAICAGVALLFCRLFSRRSR